jgi:hypothetical protein
MSNFHQYHEGHTKRGLDEICSLLLDYITNHASETVKEHHFFPTAVLPTTETTLLSDYLQRQLLMGDLTKPFSRYFPVRGHFSVL